jgi:hypothetical protein
MAGMKFAAILALIVAIMLGAWAINDYQNHEAVRKDFARQGVTSLAYRTDSGANVQLDIRNMTNEHHDAEIGALSVAFFVGSAVLFSRRKRVAA